MRGCGKVSRSRREARSCKTKAVLNRAPAAVGKAAPGSQNTVSHSLSAASYAQNPAPTGAKPRHNIRCLRQSEPPRAGDIHSLHLVNDTTNDFLRQVQNWVSLASICGRFAGVRGGGCHDVIAGLRSQFGSCAARSLNDFAKFGAARKTNFRPDFVLTRTPDDSRSCRSFRAVSAPIR